MRAACPACNAEFALDALLTSEAERRAVAALLEHGLPFGAQVMRYISLFRPAKRRLGMERMASLVQELLPDIQRGAITRKGRDWPVTPELWRAAFDAVLAARDKGTLTLPLTSHGYLLEILCAQADKAEAVAERAREGERRNRGGQAPDAAQGAVSVAAQVNALVTAPPPPPAYAAGPSRAARLLREQIARAQAERTGAATPQQEPPLEPHA